MNRRTILYVVGANLAVLLIIALIYPQFMIAPGNLMQGHAALEGDCFACHAPFRGSRPARCERCHRPGEIGRVTTKGVAITDRDRLAPFHQGLIEGDCVACHSDHRGVRPFRPIARFSHELVEPGLARRCSGCHPRPQNSLHEVVAGNCGLCHTTRAWTPANFDHNKYFMLDEEHQTACTTCHRGGDYGAYTCYGCHAHTRAGIREKHLEEGIRSYDNCIECHRGGEDDEAPHRRGGQDGGAADHGEQDSDDEGAHEDGGEHDHD